MYFVSFYDTSFRFVSFLHFSFRFISFRFVFVSQFSSTLMKQRLDNHLSTRFTVAKTLTFSLTFMGIVKAVTNQCCLQDYEKKVWTVMIHQSTNINWTNNQISPQHIEYRKQRHMPMKMQFLAQEMWKKWPNTTGKWDSLPLYNWISRWWYRSNKAINSCIYSCPLQQPHYHKRET